MAYLRYNDNPLGVYAWTDGKYMNIDHKGKMIIIPEKVLNLLLYKMQLREEEFKERVAKGKAMMDYMDETEDWMALYS